MPAMLGGGRVSAVILEVPCEGETHHVRLERSEGGLLYKVTLLNHGDMSEKTLAAFASFGAPVPTCWLLAEQWQRDPWWAAAGFTPAASRAPYEACRSCGWESTDDELSYSLTHEDVAFLAEGEPTPSGNCPRCDGFTYVALKRKHPIVKAIEKAEKAS